MSAAALKTADALAAMRRHTRTAAKETVKAIRLMRANPRAARRVPLREVAHLLEVSAGLGREYAKAVTARRVKAAGNGKEAR